MRIITYSDLHLEFGSGWIFPPDATGDLLILAGDIITLEDLGPLDLILRQWKKPALYVTGNHEYYTRRPMNHGEAKFKVWLERTHPHVRPLFDDAITIDGINFFGGTMWTDFKGADRRAMETARAGMNDFRLICNPDGSRFRPEDAVALHDRFTARLRAWLARDLPGPRVVITHNAPVINPHTRYRNNPLWPAFNSLDMVQIIEQYQPALWVYGHTHQCDDHRIAATRIISNQLGYPDGSGGFECADFDRAGIPVEIDP
jgi:predicted phosphodiesterase